MKCLDIGQASDSLGQYVRDLANEPLLVTEGGQPVAALVPLDEDDAMSFALAGDPRFLALIERSRAEARSGLAVPAAEVRRILGLS
jgi:antitoxin (DNA-binding transcriptional repressor) of toxin-antitoxin stability system